MIPEERKKLMIEAKHKADVSAAFDAGVSAAHEAVTTDGWGRWLAENQREPWQLDDTWYWCEDQDPNSYGRPEDHAVPPEVWKWMFSPVTYPDCRAYRSARAARVDFAQAFNQAVDAGWDPKRAT